MARVIGVSNNRVEGRVGATISDIKWTPDHLYLAAGYSDGCRIAFIYYNRNRQKKIQLLIAPRFIQENRDLLGASLDDSLLDQMSLEFHSVSFLASS